MHVICLRHGQTDHNLNNIVQGQTNTLLNSTGDEQARAARDIVSNVIPHSPDAVYASDLQRAIRAAELIFETYDVQCDERFREQDFGDAVGQSMGEFLDANPDFRAGEDDEDSFTKPFPNGESAEDVYNSVTDVFTDIVSNHEADDVIAIVANTKLWRISSLVRRQRHGGCRACSRS